MASERAGPATGATDSESTVEPSTLTMASELREKLVTICTAAAGVVARSTRAAANPAAALLLILALAGGWLGVELKFIVIGTPRF